MPLKPARLASLVAVATFVASPLATGGCGARTELHGCSIDAECTDMRDLCNHFACVRGRCQQVSRTTCDDGDACTDDACDKKTGACVFSHRTLDVDGDGHYAPRLGTLPGEPSACGDDCDDTDPRAHPGAKEVCDGVDDDCNGIVDDGARYTPSAFGSEVQVSELTADYAEPDALSRGGSRALALYSASAGGQLSSELRLLDATNKPVTVPASLTGVRASGANSDAAWTGDRWGVVWNDRRDGNYEIYFASFDASGNKLAPGDSRLTVSAGFSLYPSVVWTGQEFVVVWQEDADGGQFSLAGQRLALDGTLLGPIVALASGSLGQGPVVAAGRRELGLAWVEGGSNSQVVRFEPLRFDLAPLSPPVTLTTGGLQGTGARIVFNGASYVVGFSGRDSRGFLSYATLVGGDASVIVPATPIAPRGGNVRDAALLPLGDRILVVYADDRDGNQGYELYARTLWADLSPLSAPVRITQAAGDSIGAHVAFTPNGSVGILFRDDRGKAPTVLATTLACTL